MRHPGVVMVFFLVQLILFVATAAIVATLAAFLEESTPHTFAIGFPPDPRIAMISIPVIAGAVWAVASHLRRPTKNQFA